jgi:hypothetical protein
LTEATVCDIQLDINIYVKLLIALYSDDNAKFNASEFLSTLFVLFGNDHNSDNFTLGTELVREFLWSNQEDIKLKNLSNKKKSKTNLETGLNTYENDRLSSKSSDGSVGIRTSDEILETEGREDDVIPIPID